MTNQTYQIKHDKPNQTKLSQQNLGSIGGFFLLRGGVPPISANGFWAGDDFPLRGEGDNLQLRKGKFR